MNRMSACNFVYSRDLECSCGQYSTTNCRCDVSAFDLRRSMRRLSKIDVSTFEDRCVALRGFLTKAKVALQRIRRATRITHFLEKYRWNGKSEVLPKIDVSPFEHRCHDVSTFGDRCGDFRRSICRPSDMDVLTFEER